MQVELSRVLRSPEPDESNRTSIFLVYAEPKSGLSFGLMLFPHCAFIIFWSISTDSKQTSTSSTFGLELKIINVEHEAVVLVHCFCRSIKLYFNYFQGRIYVANEYPTNRKLQISSQIIFEWKTNLSALMQNKQIFMVKITKSSFFQYPAVGSQKI